MHSPRWLFLYPGAALMALGALGYALAMPGVASARALRRPHPARLDARPHRRRAGDTFAICAKTLAIATGVLPPNARMERFHRVATLERGLLASAAHRRRPGAHRSAVNNWRLHDFGNLDYVSTMRIVVPGVMLTAIGVQTLLASFLISIMRTIRS